MHGSSDRARKAERFQVLTVSQICLPALQLTFPHQFHSCIDREETDIEPLTFGSTTCKNENGTFPIRTAKSTLSQQSAELCSSSL